MRGADQLAPLRLFGANALAQFLWRTGDRFEILRVEERFLDSRIGEGLAHLAVDLGDYVGRNAGRPEQQAGRRVLAAAESLQELGAT